MVECLEEMGSRKVGWRGGVEVCFRCLIRFIGVGVFASSILSSLRSFSEFEEE